MDVAEHLRNLLKNAESAERAYIEDARKANERAAAARAEQDTIRAALDKLGAA